MGHAKMENKYGGCRCLDEPRWALADQCGLVAQLLLHVLDESWFLLLDLRNQVLLSGLLPGKWNKAMELRGCHLHSHPCAG